MSATSPGTGTEKLPTPVASTAPPPTTNGRGEVDEDRAERRHVEVAGTDAAATPNGCPGCPTATEAIAVVPSRSGVSSSESAGGAAMGRSPSRTDELLLRRGCELVLRTGEDREDRGLLTFDGQVGERRDRDRRPGRPGRERGASRQRRSRRLPTRALPLKTTGTVEGNTGAERPRERERARRRARPPTTRRRSGGPRPSGSPGSCRCPRCTTPAVARAPRTYVAAAFSVTMTVSLGSIALIVERDRPGPRRSVRAAGDRRDAAQRDAVDAVLRAARDLVMDRRAARQRRAVGVNRNAPGFPGPSAAVASSAATVTTRKPGAALVVGDRDRRGLRGGVDPVRRARADRQRRRSPDPSTRPSSDRRDRDRDARRSRRDHGEDGRRGVVGAAASAVPPNASRTASGAAVLPVRVIVNAPGIQAGLGGGGIARASTLTRAAGGLSSSASR